MASHAETKGASTFARVVAIGAVIAVVLLVAVLMFGGGDKPYTVSATFETGGQLVKGNQVEVGGRPIGTVKDIELTDNGQAKVTMELKEFAPLHAGTTAVVRANSLSGIANRYVSLTPGPDSGTEIPEGGKIGVDKTTAPVDLDQLFNTLDPDTRKGLQQLVQGSAAQFDGKSKEANEAAKYFNPALSTSSKLLEEVVLDRDAFRGFVTDSAALTGALAERRDDLAGLVTNTNETAGAIAEENVALGRALGLLPGTLRKANTTFVNLRATLEDLTVLVDASKPATKELEPFFRKLRPLVRDAEPTIKDLSQLIRKRGAGNDAIDLLQKAPKLASITDTAFPRTVRAFQKTQPVLEFARPYTPDFAGWLTKFGQGAANYDANGHFARISAQASVYSLANFASLVPLPAAQQGLTGYRKGVIKRCPGAAQQALPDGSSPNLERAGSCNPADSPR